jgi:hypothetical protein
MIVSMIESSCYIPGTLYNKAQFSIFFKNSLLLLCSIMAKAIADKKLIYTLAERLEIVKEAYDNNGYTAVKATNRMLEEALSICSSGDKY